MKQLFGSLFLTLLINLSIFSQVESQTKLIDRDKDKYEDGVFNKEFGESSDTTNATQKLIDRIPQKLPDWIFIPIDSNTKGIVAYSDPNMNRKEAYEQAVLRAKAMYVLINYSTVSNITDDYTNMRESGRYSLYTTKFQDFSLSKAQLAYNNSKVSLIDSFFTKYNEAIVYIKFDHLLNSKENKDTLIVKGEHLQIFTEGRHRTEKIELFNLTISDDLYNNDSSDLTAQYNYRVINRGYDIYSIVNNNTINFEERTYNYKTEIDFVMDSTKTEMNLFRLNKGLWNGYISGFLSNVTVLSKKLSSYVKNSNDFYTLRNEGLIRTVSRNKVSFGFNSFEMFQNQFYIDLNGQIIY